MPKKKPEIRVLVVEDEPALQELYATKLKSDGFAVTVAGDGIDGIHQAVNLQPAVILLDVLLPKKDGFSVLKDLKGDNRTKEIPVIVLSSLGQDFEVKKGKMEGAFDYMIKTDASPSDIVAKVKQAIASR